LHRYRLSDQLTVERTTANYLSPLEAKGLLPTGAKEVFAWASLEVEGWRGPPAFWLEYQAAE